MSRVLRLALRGPEGHPVHPPLASVAIGALTTASGALLAGTLGWRPDLFAPAAVVCLGTGLLAAVPTAVTGLADLIRIPPDRPARTMGIAHMAVMIGALGSYVVTAFLLWPHAGEGLVPASAAVVGAAAFCLLAAGGGLGGTLTFSFGVRVVGRGDPANLDRAAPERERGDAPEDSG